MAAFCGCCGAEISELAEVCSVCGTPRHGMIPSGLPTSLAPDSDPLCCVATATASGEEAAAEDEKV